MPYKKFEKLTIFNIFLKNSPMTRPKQIKELEFNIGNNFCLLYMFVSFYSRQDLKKKKKKVNHFFIIFWDYFLYL